MKPRENVKVEKLDIGTLSILQILSALAIGIFYYMIAVVWTVYEGPLSLIFQPLMGLIFASIAIIGLFLIGLPIRLLKRVHQWWKAHWWISYILGSIAFAMMWASWMPYFRIEVIDPDLQVPVESFHPLLAAGGWLLTIFAVLDFYPPLLVASSEQA